MKRVASYVHIVRFCLVFWDARVKPEHDNYLSVIVGLIFLTVIFGLDPNMTIRKKRSNMTVRKKGRKFKLRQGGR